jgi:hypothetical protein
MLLHGAPLAQLDRASGYEPEGREFESLRARHSFQCLRGFLTRYPGGVPAVVAFGFTFVLRSLVSDGVYASPRNVQSFEDFSLLPMLTA